MISCRFDYLDDAEHHVCIAELARQPFYNRSAHAVAALQDLLRAAQRLARAA